jgi:GT2 family glycosyltransferase
MAGPRASIVVVTTVNAAGLERCVAALAALGSDEPQFETIVVLNGAEEPVREVAARAAAVTVVESVVNRGFAGGSNLGRAAASGEFVVLLHDDAEPQAGWLSALVRCAEEQPEAGAIGSRVLNPDGTLQLAGAVLWRDATTYSVSGADGDFPRRRAVDYAGSSALLVRAASWDAVGGMDDLLYPAYFVDADLATAIRARGEAIYYEPAARVLHDRGASTAERMRTFLFARNRERFRSKWADMLARQEEPGNLARALARAEDEAARFRAAGPRAAPPALPPAPADDRLFLHMDREIKDALIDQLTGEVEALHATIRRKDGELIAQEAALRKLHDELSRRAGSSQTG